MYIANSESVLKSKLYYSRVMHSNKGNKYERMLPLLLLLAGVYGRKRHTQPCDIAVNTAFLCSTMAFVRLVQCVLEAHSRYPARSNQTGGHTAIIL